jgi:hypothetical protein
VATEKPEVEDQPEEEPAQSDDGTEEPPSDEEEPEEDKAAAKADDEWSASAKARVAEETAKRKRANERADRVEGELSKTQARIAELEQSLSQVSGPSPTQDNPLIDIQNGVELDRLERQYEKIVDIDLNDTDDEGTIPLVVSKDKKGEPVWKKFTPEEVKVLQNKADRALRRDIPKRREYLSKREQATAQVVQIYPELSNPEDEFTQQVAYLARKVMSGEAMSDPEAAAWCAHAIKGYRVTMEELKSRADNNGKTSPAVRQIVESAKTKLAPTASRTRGSVERKADADLKQIEKEFETNPDDPSVQLRYTQAMLSKKNRSQIKRVEQVSG